MSKASIIARSILVILPTLAVVSAMLFPDPEGFWYSLFSYGVLYIICAPMLVIFILASPILIIIFFPGVGVFLLFLGVGVFALVRTATRHRKRAVYRVTDPITDPHRLLTYNPGETIRFD